MTTELTSKGCVALAREGVGRRNKHPVHQTEKRPKWVVLQYILAIVTCSKLENLFIFSNGIPYSSLELRCRSDFTHISYLMGILAVEKHNCVDRKLCKGIPQQNQGPILVLNSNFSFGVITVYHIRMYSGIIDTKRLKNIPQCAWGPFFHEILTLSTIKTSSKGK